MNSRELWQSVMDQTEKEIQTGHYTISFSKYEVYQFPKPPLLTRIKISCWNFLIKTLDRILHRLRVGQIIRAIRRLSHA